MHTLNECVWPAGAVLNVRTNLLEFRILELSSPGTFVNCGLHQGCSGDGNVGKGELLASKEESLEIVQNVKSRTNMGKFISSKTPLVSWAYTLVNLSNCISKMWVFIVCQ